MSIDNQKLENFFKQNPQHLTEVFEKACKMVVDEWKSKSEKSISEDGWDRFEKGILDGMLFAYQELKKSVAPDIDFESASRQHVLDAILPSIVRERRAASVDDGFFDKWSHKLNAYEGLRIVALQEARIS